jgi:polyisoprenoid-binding protein YceI
MATWIFEPGHTEAGFSARHMMVTWVRGFFKEVTGEIEFDLDRCLETTFSGQIDATRIWTGQPVRDAHLRNADFFDVANYPSIDFAGRFVKQTGGISFIADTELTIRGQTRNVPLDVVYQGEWQTPFWEGEENRGNMRRIGLHATGRINRHDFGVSWQDELPDGGVVVGDEIDLVLDAEAINHDDLVKTGAIALYA